MTKIDTHMYIYTTLHTYNVVSAVAGYLRSKPHQCGSWPPNNHPRWAKPAASQGKKAWTTAVDDGIGPNFPF